MNSPCLEKELKIRDAFNEMDNLMLHHYMDVFLYC
jgi:hypothetical protein